MEKGRILWSMWKRSQGWRIVWNMDRYHAKIAANLQSKLIKLMVGGFHGSTSIDFMYVSKWYRHFRSKIFIRPATVVLFQKSISICTIKSVTRWFKWQRPETDLPNVHRVHCPNTSQPSLLPSDKHHTIHHLQSLSFPRVIHSKRLLSWPATNPDVYRSSSFTLIAAMLPSQSATCIELESLCYSGFTPWIVRLRERVLASQNAPLCKKAARQLRDRDL